MINRDFILKQYEEIRKRESISRFYKVDLHIHTPASKNDYKINNQYYENATIEELKQAVVEQGIIDKENINIVSLSKDDIAALLIIHEACANKDLNMIVVTDHNNIDWYDRLVEAAATYFSKYNPRNKLAKDFYILPGAEITCFNGAHIIAILEPKNYKNNWSYLSFELSHEMDINNEIFTTKSEMDVVHAIKKVGGIVYIPHIDNNSQKLRMEDILDPLAGLSKAELFINKSVQAVGFTQYDRFKDFVEGILTNPKHRYFRKFPLAYMQDSDAHSIHEIGRRYMYIKMSNLSFESLRFALEEPELRIRKNIEYSKEIPYIRGVVTDGGFLSKDNGRLSYYPFNKDLNCIIGGRGTGKSTLINCIKSCFEGRTEEAKFRRFIGKFNSILIFFYFEKKNYCLVCEPAIKIDNYTGEEVGIHGNRVKQEQVIIEDWIKVYELSEAKIKKVSIGKQAELLANFHIDFFKQAQVFRIGEDEKYLKEFISSVFNRCIGKEVYIGLIEQLKNELNVINQIVNDVRLVSAAKIDKYMYSKERIQDINKKLDIFRSEIIEKLNNNMDNKVMIIYKSNNKNLEEKLQIMLENYSRLTLLSNVKTDNISKCIEFLCKRYDFFTLWRNLETNKHALVTDIKNNNILLPEDVDDIVEDSVIEECVNILEELFIKNVRNTNEFKDNYRMNVEFNVNSYNLKNNSKLFKSLEDLSLGQKAVAILLIITEGINGLVKSFPLIIDQPEDHLDNRFIFEHLVKSIRDLKEERQVLLVTHNANIPVAGDAENVVYLVSDNKNGWVDMHGPIDDMKISDKVLSIMEGGKESFNIRNNKYKILNYVK